MLIILKKLIPLSLCSIVALTACTSSGGQFVYEKEVQSSSDIQEFMDKHRKPVNTDISVALYYITIEKQRNHGQAIVRVDNSKRYKDRKIGRSLWRYNLNKELQAMKISANDFESQSGAQQRLHLDWQYELVVSIKCLNKRIPERLQKINFSPSEFAFEPDNTNYINLPVKTEFCNNPRYDVLHINYCRDRD